MPNLVHAGTLDSLTNRETLQPLLGPLRSVTRTSSFSAGLSGAEFERVTVEAIDGSTLALVTKRIRLRESWTAYRSGDRQGREALLLGEPQLDGVWQAVSCPYLALAREGDLLGMVMVDLSAHLVPANLPLNRNGEDRFLHALARLHAGFWNGDALQLPWLAGPEDYFSILCPRAPAEEERRGNRSALFNSIKVGWELALNLLPSSLADLLLQPAQVLAWCVAGLPQTLLHGDAKVGNMALLPDGAVAVFDWAVVGAGPATFDLCYYLTVDSRRLSGPREHVIARYRGFLEHELGLPLEEPVWQRMLDAGYLRSAVVLLWSKATALQSGEARAKEEWAWWVKRLERLL
jgi:hypothetical protein